MRGTAVHQKTLQLSDDSGRDEHPRDGARLGPRLAPQKKS